MRPVVDSVRRKLRGLSKRYPGGVLKSAMQRLEQGDVVTETQSAPEWPAVGGDVHPACYKTMQPNRRLLKHLTGGGFGVKFSKDTGPCTGQARRRVF